MDYLEDEAVAQQGSGNRQWTQINANAEVLGVLPNTAVDSSPLRINAARTTSLPKDQIREHSRLFVFIGGLIIFGSCRIGLCKSLIFKLILRKSLIFADIFGYF